MVMGDRSRRLKRRNCNDAVEAVLFTHSMCDAIHHQYDSSGRVRDRNNQGFEELRLDGGAVPQLNGECT